jgi:enoyl-CoA hydratase
LEILLTTDPVDAQRAYEIGLVNKVVPQADLMSTSRAILGKIMRKSPLAVGKVIDCVNSFYESNQNGMEKEIKEFGEAFGTTDFKEGTTAFIEKRKARF